MKFSSDEGNFCITTNHAVAAVRKLNTWTFFGSFCRYRKALFFWSLGINNMRLTVRKRQNSDGFSEQNNNSTSASRFSVNVSGAPNDGFLLNTLKTLFRLSRVLLDL